LRAAAPEVPELGELVDAGAAAASDSDVFPDPAGIDSQIWEDCFTWDDPLFEGALGLVASLSAIEPAVLLASVAGSSPPSSPPVDAPTPALETFVSASVDPTSASRTAPLSCYYLLF